MNIHKLGAYGGALFLGLLVIYLVMAPSKKTVTPEMVDKLIRAQNDRADVESQLRAAEAGDLAKVQGGRVWAILWNNLRQGGEITLSNCPGPHNSIYLYRTDDASKRVSSVIKYSPDSTEYTEAAKAYILCERLK